MEAIDMDIDEYYREPTPTLFDIYMKQYEGEMIHTSQVPSDELHDETTELTTYLALTDSVLQLYVFESYLANQPPETPVPEQGFRPQDLWREPTDPCPLSPSSLQSSLPPLNDPNLDTSMYNCTFSSPDPTFLKANSELSTLGTPALTTAGTYDLESDAEWALSVPPSPPPRRLIQQSRSRDEVSKPYDKLKTQRKTSAIARRSLDAAGITICPVNDPLHRDHLGHLCCSSTNFPDISRYNWEPYVRAVVKSREYKAKFDPEVITAVLECPPDNNGPRACPFIASGCDMYANADNTLWARHVKTHSTAKVWICDRCDASLSRADALLRHKKDTCQFRNL